MMKKMLVIFLSLALILSLCGTFADAFASEVDNSVGAIEDAMMKGIRILSVFPTESTTCAKALPPTPFPPQMISRRNTITARAEFRTIPAAICCGGCPSRRATPLC